MKIVFFDLETTGLPISWDESYSNIYNWPYIIQLAYIVSYNENEVSIEQDIILKPDGFEVPLKSTEVHGISNEQALIEGFNRKEILENFASIILDANYIVAHNAAFDINVLRCEFLRNDIEDPFKREKSIICTMKKSTNFCKIPSNFGDYKWPSLQELYFKLFQNHFKDEHNAKYDVKATFDCFWELFQKNIIKIIIKQSNKIVLSKEQEKLKEIVSENYNAFIILLSYYYPFTVENLYKFKAFLNWDYISQNKNIKWSVDLITKFQEKIIFSKEYSISGPNFDDVYNEGLNYNPAISDNFDIINFFPNEWKSYNSLFNFEKSKTIFYILDKYYDKLDFNALSYQRVQWPKIVLNRFKKDFNWQKLSEYAIWDTPTIDEFKDLLDWNFLSQNEFICFSIELIDKYINRWVWSSLVRNNAINITYEFLSKFKQQFDWETVNYYLGKSKLPIQQFEDFIDFIDWEIVSKQYPFSYDFLKEFEDKINWDLIHLNPNISWTTELINKLEYKLVVNKLNLINTVWNEQLIEKYKSYLTLNLDEYGNMYGDECYPISWNELSMGGINHSTKYYRFHKIEVSYSFSLINEYKEFWNWNKLSSNIYVNWTIDMIRAFHDKLDFKVLSKNESVVWSNELIIEFSEYWDFNSLLNNKKIVWAKHLVGDYGSMINLEKIDSIDEFQRIIQFSNDLRPPINLMENSFESSPLYKVNSYLTDNFLYSLVQHEK